MQFKNMAKLPEFEPEYLRNQSKAVAYTRSHFRSA